MMPRTPLHRCPGLLCAGGTPPTSLFFTLKLYKHGLTTTQRALLVPAAPAGGCRYRIAAVPAGCSGSSGDANGVALKFWVDTRDGQDAAPGSGGGGGGSRDWSGAAGPGASPGAGPGAGGGVPAPPFRAYLRSHCLCVDVWDADSLFCLGSCQVRPQVIGMS